MYIRTGVYVLVYTPNASVTINGKKHLVKYLGKIMDYDLATKTIWMKRVKTVVEFSNEEVVDNYEVGELILTDVAKIIYVDKAICKEFDIDPNVYAPEDSENVEQEFTHTTEGDGFTHTSTI